MAQLAARSTVTSPSIQLKKPHIERLEVRTLLEEQNIYVFFEHFEELAPRKETE